MGGEFELGSNDNSVPYSSSVGLEGGVDQCVLKSIMNGSISSSGGVPGRTVFIVGYVLLVDKQMGKGTGRSWCNISRL